ncbi:deoxynucleoside kinase [Emticicia oligotrophica DSM 17448]|uniref:Deoxynucleoside kinase n=1 Tax=Emticicia oligotrophica (strain DSM 17448 / CIP 109782 / MTCC 6937 / GPTSA100-15) TaxID=929562 RepID=A0ABN4ATP9_EMTOG|nr:deoxynucleoside kinase [Emticicia oligotrophica]AFK05305.1 deoxynucleoside kinase [Emticicia oligotrophica DSM 17448]
MHIAITGNIGAGKTTLATKLANHYGWEVLYEAVDGNPYLPPFYEDMEKWAFHLQIYFLNSRFEQVLKIKQLTERKTIIQDRSIYEDAYIFARNLYETGKFNETDYQTYKSMFNTITQAISHPDLMIYLRADLTKLQRQINKRGRDFEKNIDPNYLLSLNKLYEDFVELYTHGKLLVIDVNDLDYAESEDDFRYITEIIDNNISMGTQLSIQNI